MNESETRCQYRNEREYFLGCFLPTINATIFTPGSIAVAQWILELATKNNQLINSLSILIGALVFLGGSVILPISIFKKK